MKQFLNYPLTLRHIEVLLANRELIGKEWFKWLNEKKIPFVIRIRIYINTDKEFMNTSNIDELFKYIEIDEFYSFGKTKLFDIELVIIFENRLGLYLK